MVDQSPGRTTLLPLHALVAVHLQGGNVLLVLQAELAQEDALLGLELVDGIIAVIPRLASILPDHTLLDATRPHNTGLVVLIVARGYERPTTPFCGGNI